MRPNNPAGNCKKDVQQSVAAGGMRMFGILQVPRKKANKIIRTKKRESIAKHKFVNHSGYSNFIIHIYLG